MNAILRLGRAVSSGTGDRVRKRTRLDRPITMEAFVIPLRVIVPAKMLRLQDLTDYGRNITIGNPHIMQFGDVLFVFPRDDLNLTNIGVILNNIGQSIPIRLKDSITWMIDPRLTLDFHKAPPAQALSTTNML